MFIYFFLCTINVLSSTSMYRALLHGNQILQLTPAPSLDLSSTLRESAMEKFNIGYSTKNIHLPSRKDYPQRLIEKTEQLRRMRWKAHFFLNPDTTSIPKETYGFKSTKNPPPIEELKDLEDDMLKMIQSVKFKQGNNPFLNKLKEETDHIKSEPKLLIAVDKTTNFYKLEPSTYNDLLEKKTSRNLTRKHNPRRRKQSIKKTKTSRRN